VRLAGGQGSVSLRVEDTGDGFDLDEGRKSGGLGLISMEERARSTKGHYTLASKPSMSQTQD
jgi:signal transduction histidine kinase